MRGVQCRAGGIFLPLPPSWWCFRKLESLTSATCYHIPLCDDVGLILVDASEKLFRGPYNWIRYQVC